MQRVSSGYVPHSPRSPYGENLQIKRGKAVGAKEEEQGSSHTNSNEKPSRPKIAPLRIDQVRDELDRHFAVSQRENDDRLKRKNALPQIARISRRALRTMENLRVDMSPDERQRTDTIVDEARKIIAFDDSDVVKSDPETVQEASADSGDLSSDSWDALADDAKLVQDVKYLLLCMREVASDHPGSSPDAQQQRRWRIIDYLGALLRNEFKSDAGRWAANVINVGLRTGIVVTLCKFMGDAIAFEVSRASMLGAPYIPVAAILAITIAPTFNLLGAISSGCLGTANRISIIARSALGIMNLAAILACYMTRSLESMGTQLAPIVCYCLARDICNFFFPLRDNLRTLPLRAVLPAGLIYILGQWFGGVAIDIEAPLFGAHGLPSPAGNGTVLPEALLAASLNLKDSVFHSAFNAIPLEWADDLVVATIVKRTEKETYLRDKKNQLGDEAAHKEYIERLSGFAKNLLMTPAADRQESINRINTELYAEEFQRMKKEEHSLDEPHKQYLEQLKILEPAFSENPDISKWGTLREFEKELGIYSRPRELARMDRGNPEQLNDTQRTYLDHLRDDVDAQRVEFNRLTQLDEMHHQYLEVLRDPDPARRGERLENLKEKKRDSPVGPDGQIQFGEKEKKRLESLRHEFEDSSTLPPMYLLRDAAYRTPDFTRLDKRANSLCQRLSPGTKKKERQKVVEELFVYEFVRAYLPCRPTALENDVLNKLLDEKPRLPSDFTKKWLDEVEVQRDKDMEGPRIQLGFLPSTGNFIDSVGRTFLVTNPARQSVFGAVIGLLTALGAALEAAHSNLTEDSHDITRIVFWNLMLGMIIYTCYWALYLVHREGESSERRVQRPGAQGDFPLVRKEPETLKDVITPRGRENEIKDTKRNDRASISEGLSSRMLPPPGLENEGAEPLDPYTARNVRRSNDEQSSEEEPMDNYEGAESSEEDETRAATYNRAAQIERVTRLTHLPLDLSELSDPSDSLDSNAARQIQSME